MASMCARLLQSAMIKRDQHTPLLYYLCSTTPKKTFTPKHPKMGFSLICISVKMTWQLDTEKLNDSYMFSKIPSNMGTIIYYLYTIIKIVIPCASKYSTESELERFSKNFFSIHAL